MCLSPPKVHESEPRPKFFHESLLMRPFLRPARLWLERALFLAERLHLLLPHTKARVELPSAVAKWGLHRYP